MMKKRYLNYIILSIIICTGVYGQSSNKDVLFSIDGKEYYKDGFIRTFQRRNNMYTSEIKTVEENLDLYINLKLKVLEAKKLKMDTSSTFKREILSFRRQLARTYLTDSETDERMVREAYERMAYDLKVSHILLRVAIDAPAEDTLRAYRKAIKIRNRILADESFEALAKETSDEPQAKTTGGDLGYFTVFAFLYPFETAAYNLNVGDISMPVRSYFGYHIIKLTDKRKARGKIRYARIVVNVNPDSSPEEKEQGRKNIYNYYDLLKSGESFASVAQRFSEDERSSKRGGEETNWLTVGYGHPTFNKAVYSLENIGDYSEPIFDGFSWQIIKLIEHQEIQELNKIRKEIETKVSRDRDRSQISINSIVERLKKEYNYAEDTLRIAEFYRIVDPSIFIAAWPRAKAAKLDKILFEIDGKEYSQQEFALFLERTMSRIDPSPISEYVDNKYNEFVKESILQFEDSMLENKYPEFKHLLQEFFEGNLLFELTDKMVWSKAQKDSIGLRNFYNENKNNYMWGDRVKAKIFTVSSPEKHRDLTAEVIKLVEKSVRRNYSEEEIRSRLNEITSKYPESKVDINSGVFSKGTNKIIDAITWKTGVSATLEYEKSSAFVLFEELVDPEPKELDQTRGMITADYQNYLEAEWIKQMRNEHNIKIEKDVLSDIEL